MGWLMAIALANTLLTQEIEEIVETAQNLQKSAVEELIKEPSNTQMKKCYAGSLPTELEKPTEKKPTLLVFISFSVPEAAWQEYSSYLVDHQGAFVLRGLPNNSFSDLCEKVMALRKQGVLADILLAPDLYKKHKVSAVPAIVLEGEGRVHKIIGNIPITSALRLFKESDAK